MKKHHWGILFSALIASILFSFAIRLLIPEEPMIVEKFQEQSEIPVRVYEYKFGKSGDSLVLINEEVKRNETFLQILQKHNISGKEAKEILGKTREIFDFQKIHTGNKYTVYKTPDSSKQMKALIY